MEHNNLNNNIDIFNRKLVELKDAINISSISKGQAKFIEVYMSIALSVNKVH